jgi:Type VI secretion system (T6SS), amidase effector protein 4
LEDFMAITFKALRSHYPTIKKEQLFEALGGQWPGLLKEDTYKNTCAVRLSLALRGAGAAIPKKYQEAIDGAGASLVIKVETMGRLVRELFGEPSWGMSKVVGSEVPIPAVQGIIVYHVKWADATGYFDLWTGTDFVGEGERSDIAKGFDVALWMLK